MEIISKYRSDFSDFLQKKVELKNPINLYEPILYILNLGGKRLRPILSIMTCDILGGDKIKSYDAAIAVEVFHNFTLIHDDIMDKALMRRGKETVHKKWDVNTGILSGDAMMILAYQYLESYEGELFKQIMKLFNKTALEVCEGQQMDIDFESRNDVSIDEYIKMITLKTSVLVGATMKMGAIIAERDKKISDDIYNFGLNLGIAFQLQDDYLDTFGNLDDFGKRIGGDISENKKTFLYLKTLEVCDSTDKERLLDLFKLDQKTEEEINEVIQIFKNNSIPKLIRNEIELYTNKAFLILDKIEISDDKKSIFKEFGIELMDRNV